MSITLRLPIFISEAEVADLIDISTTISVLDRAFRAEADGVAVNRSRIRIPIEGGFYNLMAARDSTSGVVGLKVYTATKHGAPMLIVLHASDGTGLRAIIEGGKISGCRTGALSGLSAQYMAREGKHVLGVIGTGFQARMQILGVAAAVDVERIILYSRNVEKAQAFADKMALEVKVPIALVTTSAEVCQVSSIIVLITNSAEPVIKTVDVKPGTHVIAAGNNTWLRSEFEPSLAARAAVVAVDNLDQARIEAGELMRAVELGLFSWEQAVSLGQIVGQKRLGRNSGEDVTLFCSQGVALLDVTVAQFVYEQALKNGRGHALS